MSKYTVKELWEERYGKAEEVIDYAGRRMLKAACGDPYSSYQPTIDHIKPISKGGKDVKGNIEICHIDTNFERAIAFLRGTPTKDVFMLKELKAVQQTT